MSIDLLNGKGIRLYNLFPRLVGNIARWKTHLNRIAGMKFNAVFVNPFHYPGFSGSLYAPKDYYKFNPMFIDDNSPLSPSEQLRDFVNDCHEHGLLFIMDLVINHTAIDCPLIEEHPTWFKRTADGRILHPGAWHDGRWMEWGDLAEVDNEHSPDRANLWEFWRRMIYYYIDMGIDGFRCDMAYHLPDDLWRYLIYSAKQKKPGCLFLAESLGCHPDKLINLASVGFDYLFNSIKYWDFNQPWGMEQYYRTANIVSTIAFPESHDTPRLINEYNGDLAAVKRQLLFSALFSRGFMIPIGFEFGFRRKCDVVATDPSWWENTGIDLTDFVRKVCVLKDSNDALNHEAGLAIVDQENWYNVFCFKRAIAGAKPVLAALNKDRFNHQRLYLPNLAGILGNGIPRDISPEYAMESVPQRFEYNLRPSEVKIITLA